MRRREPFEDAGRTIADMSGIAPQPTIVPRRKPRKEPETNSGEGLELTRKEKRWAVPGAMKAALLIAGAYLLGLGILLGILFLIWKP